MPKNSNSRYGTPAAARSAISASDLDRRLKDFMAELNETDQRVRALDKLVGSRKKKGASSKKNNADPDGEIEKILKNISENFGSSSGQKK